MGDREDLAVQAAKEVKSVVKMDTWQRVKEIFAQVIDMPAEDRERELAELCRDDAKLRTEVESWLASYDEAENFLENPAVAHPEFPSALRLKGRRFGNYTIESEIGRGGMGTVYLASRSDGEFDQKVAIKIVRQSIAEGYMIERFRRERQILATLNHPNIAKLLDGGVTDKGEPYLVMEYVDGRPISDFATDLSLQDRLGLFLKVCGGLSYAHRSLVVHRDIKPDNILVTADGEPKLLDFGLAKLVDESLGTVRDQTQTAFRALTPAYASPEQLKGEQFTTVSDVYSLGVVFYELLSGTRPFHLEGKNLDEIIRTVGATDPSAPSENPRSSVRYQLKGDLDNIALKALRPEPERRYSTVDQFAEDIRRFLDGLPVTARKATFTYTATKFIRRHRVVVTAAFLILVTFFTGLAFIVREKRKADRRFSDLRRLATSLVFEVDNEIQKGPTRGRAMIARGALEYLDSLTQESGNESDLQLELAAGYLKVGDIQGKPYRPNLGDTLGAETSYEKARLLLEPITAGDPANLEAKRYLSLAHQSLGRVQQRNNKWDIALENERRAVELSEEIVSDDPKNADYRSLLADNYIQFGAALYQSGRGATIDDHYQAITYFRKALDLHLSLSSDYPQNADYRYAMGVDYEFIGIAFNRLGDLTGNTDHYRSALENHSKEFEINQELAASDRSNLTYRRIVADAYGEVALSQVKLGNTTEALANYRRRLAIFESLRSSDPTNVEAVRDLVNTLIDFGHALAQSGEKSEALTQLRRAVVLQQTLADTEPDNGGAKDQIRSLIETVNRLEQGSSTEKKSL